jgi:hypothetical protein
MAEGKEHLIAIVTSRSRMINLIWRRLDDVQVPLWWCSGNRQAWARPVDRWLDPEWDKIVTEPPKIILYYRLSLSTWPLSNNKESFYHFCRVKPGKSLTTGSILNFYSEIWRTRKKTKSAFKEHLGFDRDLGFGPRSFVQKCDKTCQTCLEAN